MDVLAKQDGEHTAFQDFTPYEPFASSPSAFMAHIVMDNNGDAIGAVAFQLPISAVGEIAAQNTGLGKTGDIFVFGEDKLLRNDLADTEALDLLTAARLTVLAHRRLSLLLQLSLRIPVGPS
jgi:methyl-accepting chemotaxis protein